MKEKLPFVTSNRALASALHMGGARILGIWRDRGTQKVTFFVDCTETLPALLAAYDEMNEKKEATLAAVSDADAVRLCHLYQMLRLDIDAAIRDPATEKDITEKGQAHIETQPDGSKLLVHPGFTVANSTASPKIKDYLRHE